MKKKTALFLALAAIITSFSGCSPKKNENTSAETTENTSASEITSAAEVTSAAENIAEDDSEWGKIAKDKVIAYVDGHDDLNITFGEFYREYRYYLISSGITDDFADDYRSSCEETRSSIITYLEFEKIFLKVAEELGVGESSLTDAELESVRTSADETIKNMCQQYSSKASEQLGEDATLAELEALELELLEEALGKCGLSTEIFYTWEKNSYVQEKLFEKITENIDITEKQVDEMFDEYVELAKAAYAESPVNYESNAAYTSVYIPEGTRLASQIILLFDDETRAAINQARTDGNTEEADRLRSEAYENNAELRQKTDDISKLIKSGNSFEELQETYNQDGSNAPYAVVPGSQYFVSEFVDGVFGIENEGGVSEPIISDFGVHFIRYDGSAELSEKDISEIRSSMSSYLHDKEVENIENSKYSEWLSAYPYITDNELLRIEVSDGENTEQTE